MSITTKSLFYYGHLINDLNFYLDFNEGSGELSAEFNVGDYSLTEFATEIERAMNEAGSQEYSATIDRDTRKITISASSNFDLLISSGSHAGNDIFSLIGFTGSDQTGSNSYEGSNVSGYEYRPPFVLQRYIDFEDYQQASQASENKAASGLVEVLSFGTEKFMECNITYVTDIDTGNVPHFDNNTSSVSNLRNFLEYITKKYKIEFMPDRDTPSDYTKCILDKTQSNQTGTGFRLYEMYGKGLANWYETKTLRFRQVS